jgi:hypothetical protein
VQHYSKHSSHFFFFIQDAPRGSFLNVLVMLRSFVPLSHCLASNSRAPVSEVRHTKKNSQDRLASIKNEIQAAEVELERELALKKRIDRLKEHFLPGHQARRSLRRSL